MDQQALPDLSPHRVFTRTEWAKLRADTPMTLERRRPDAAARPQRPDLAQRGGRDLPAAVAPAQPLCRRGPGPAPGDAHLPRHRRRGDAVHHRHRRLGGGRQIDHGARAARRCSRRWPNTPKVDLVTTDGFLLPNAVLKREGLMERKGFPESYDLAALLAFLRDIKAGKGARHGAGLFAPHLRHRARRDDQRRPAGHPDPRRAQRAADLAPAARRAGRCPSSPTSSISRSISTPTRRTMRRWYVERFLSLRETAFHDPKSYFHRYATLSDARSRATSRTACGRESTSSTCSTTSCRRGRAPT